VLVHAGFMVLFALLYHAVLAAKLQAARQAEEAAVAHRIGELERRAEEFRRIAPTAPAEDAPEQERRAAQAAVVEIEAAVRGALEIAKVALGAHTCAVFLLSDDERELRPSERLSDSDALVRDPLPAGEGALGGAVRRRAPVRLHGEVKAASYYLDGTRPGALLAVPLMDRRGGHVRGAVVADRLAPRPFSDDEERLLTAVAAEILRAVAAERLMLDHRRSRRETEAFYQALEKLNRRTTARDVFDATLEVARGLLAPTPLEFAAVTLVERQEGRPSTHRVVRAVAGADGAQGTPVEGREFADGPGLVAAAVRVEASLPGSDLDPRRSWVFDAGVQLKGVAALKVIPLKATPLRSGEPGVLGTLVLGSSRPGAFDRETVRRLEVVAMQAGEAVQRARLFDETERLATTDGLTGLLNHRTFQARLDEHLAAAQRYGRTVALALCDIDHFKSVNDTYGHPVGDQVLKAVARVLAREARATDLVARYGGEEFAVVMPETDTAGARVIAERIRERVGALRVETGQGPLAVTLSLGVATSPGDGADKPRLVEAADGCLYHAKRHGRNQTVTAASLRAPRRAGS
jgi:diguanylate cyclase (GGDEF)-like protein